MPEIKCKDRRLAFRNLESRILQALKIYALETHTEGLCLSCNAQRMVERCEIARAAVEEQGIG